MENKTVSWDEKDILTVVEQYQKALGLLDAYDHQTMERPQGHKDVYRLTYQECKQVIASMSFGKESQLFGNEKDDSFQGSIAAIYQTFGEKEVYSSLEAIFLYFLHKNGILFADGRKRLDDSALVSLTILIAQSKPSEKDMMTRLIMNCLI